jgi:hypothetical protein
VTEVPFSRSFNDIHYVVNQQVAATQTITVSWTGVTVDTPCGPYGYAVQLGTDGVAIGSEQRFAISSPSGSITRQVPGFATSYFMNVFTSGFCSTGTLHGVTSSVSSPGGFCEFGTRLAGPATAPVTYVTETLITAALDKVGAGFLFGLFAFLVGQTIDLNLLCGTGPGPIPTVAATWYTASTDQLFQWFKAILWYSFCECVPGSPPPNPYPVPALENPGNLPTPPVITCDETDICASLVAIRQSMLQLQARMNATADLVTLIQRYGTPFAFIHGAVHSNITESGSFNVPRLAGLLVEVTAGADSHEHLFGTPQYLWDMGWVSITTPDGMLEEKRVTRERMTWTPRSIQAGTLFGWALSTGVTLRVTELYAEP